MGITVRSARSQLAVAIVSSLLGATSFAPPALVTAPGEHLHCAWLAPVDAEVIDGFRPPDRPYGSGNRGLEYDVEVGDAVRAVAQGRVGFVGPVGGRVYVVVEHPSGLKSTYGPVSAPTVVRGQDLPAAIVMAAAEPGFHLTARLGERYLDPQRLIDGHCGRARLVPFAPAAAQPEVRSEVRFSPVPARVR